MGILNYTTKVDSIKTVGEIQGILAKHGASNISIDYINREPVGLCFTIPFKNEFLNFRLPSNAEGVYLTMKRDRSIPPRLRTMEQARRVAWRITKDWVESQLAIIEAGLATMPEVLFPYLLNERGETLFNSFVNNSQKYLKSGK
jgi:hypothetical protein